MELYYYFIMQNQLEILWGNAIFFMMLFIFYFDPMKKIITYFLFLSIFFVWMFAFATTTQQSFLENISQEKIKIETMFDDSYTAVYQKFQSSIGGFLTSLNYQWLVCLWVISDTLLLQQMQNDNRNLKIWFLNAYATLYADALDIEQKQRIYKDTSVSLFQNWATYETEKNRILSWLNQLVVSQKKLSTQFQSSYEKKISKFVDDYYDYSEKNKDLLSSIWTRIQTVKKIDQQYKKLTSDLLKYQIQLAWSWAKFFSKLYVLKQASISGLDISLQNIINKEIKKYKILPLLWSELSQQKLYALGLFEMWLDEKINILLDQWYDNKEFSQITKEVQTFVSTYLSGTKTQCASLISSTTFTQESERISKKIVSFTESFSLKDWTKTSSSGFQEKITKWLPIITQLQKDMTSTFTKAITQKTQLLLDEYKKKTWTLSGSIIIETETPTSPSISINSSFVFTQAFKKGQFHEDIKILQQLLTSLWYYTWSIDGIYWSKTIESVYKYQLAKNLLKWYEKKPQTWWWMWPSTRAELNKDLIK